jgi:hypothetical protein
MKKLIVLTFVAFYLSGCVLTKLVTVPMRVTGSVISIIPIVGGPIDSFLDSSADIIDTIPI